MKRKQLLTAVACAALTVPLAFVTTFGCAPDNVKPSDGQELALNIIEDNARTYYEIFVGGFADSNGDGIGDLKGLTANIDYLNDGKDETDTDLGINGIWLMPVHPSASYHKYDVIDYKEIDRDYGTLEDFDAFMTACNERNIYVQIDLVLNHSSNENEWYLNAIDALEHGYTEYEAEYPNSKYIEYYNFREAADPATGLGKMRDTTVPGWKYEANFDTTMPDLNMDCQAVRDEIESIVEFWFARGVRGFRLDAAPYVYGSDADKSYNAKNKEFWTWFNQMCYEKGVAAYGAEGETYDSENASNRYVYNVAEVWSTDDMITDFYDSKMSGFMYTMGGSESGTFIRGAKKTLAAYQVPRRVESLQKRILANDSAAIASNFLTNHDNNRSYGLLGYNVAMIKNAASLYLLAPGNPYIYYGEEIGMAGSGNDPNKRMPFEWGTNTYACEKPEGATRENGFGLGTVAGMTNDNDSVLSHYRRLIKIRNQHPEIARGTIKTYAFGENNVIDEFANVENVKNSETDDDGDNEFMLVYTTAYKDKTLLIVQNLGGSERQFSLGSFDKASLTNYVCASYGDAPTIKGDRVTIPGNAALVFKV